MQPVSTGKKTTATGTTAKKATATKATATKATATKATAKKATAKKATATKTARGAGIESLTAEEKAAMKEYAAERRARKRNASAEADAQAVQDAIAKMDDQDRELCGRLHEVITAAGPELAPRTWYGMPAYAKDGKVVCFVQNAGKFKARYTTLGFQDSAALDEGSIWATSFAVTKLTKAGEKEVAALVRRAVG